MEKIKTYEDAWRKLGYKKDPVGKLSGVDLPADIKSITAYAKLIIIVRALNDGWEPNWNDSNQWKYCAWFGIKATSKKPSGVGFSHTAYDCWDAITTVGSRLCFPTSELAIYAGNKFNKIYQEYLLKE